MLPISELTRIGDGYNDSFGFSVVDRFLIVAPSPRQEEPSEESIANLAELLELLRAEYTVLLDFTRPGIAYHDFTSILNVLGRDTTPVLTSPISLTSALRLPYYNVRYLHLTKQPTRFRFTWLPTRWFRSGCPRWSGFAGERPTGDELDLAGCTQSARRKLLRGMADPEQEVRWLVLRRLLRERASRSILNEYALQMTGKEVSLVPYHCHAVYRTAQQDQLSVVRPAVIANRTAMLLSSGITELASLLNLQNVRESQIQKCLERHPDLLRSLGYSRIRPHVILEREGENPLIPDFFVQPAGSDWWHILSFRKWKRSLDQRTGDVSLQKLPKLRPSYGNTLLTSRIHLR